MKYKGLVTPMITPFKPNGDVDFDSTRELLEYLEKINVDGVFPLGSTGVFPILSVEERKKFAEYVVNNSAKMKVFVGVGSPNTRESIDLLRHARDVGADVGVLMPPFYIKPSQDGIKKHFSEVLESTDMNLFIYNIPQLAGSYVEFETMLYLKEEFSNVVGAKESSADMRFFSKVVTLSDNNFSVFQGQDDLLFASLSLGADGGVCGTSNFSEHIVNVQKLFEEGRLDEALKIQLSVVNPMLRTINIPLFPSGYYYATYRKLGVKGGYRTPMIEPEKGDAASIDRMITKGQ